MKAMISRVFRRGGAPRSRAGDSSLSSELSAGDIQNYYLSVIGDALRRMLVPPDSVQVEVKRSGKTPGGLPAYAGYVQILKWDAVATPVLLQNLPVIDARIRKVVTASVILEATHFTGLWVQATSAAEGSPTALVGLACEASRQPACPAAET